MSPGFIFVILMCCREFLQTYLEIFLIVYPPSPEGWGIKFSNLGYDFFEFLVGMKGKWRDQYDN